MEQKIKEAYREMVNNGVFTAAIEGENGTVELIRDDNDPKLIHTSIGVNYRVQGDRRLRVVLDKPEIEKPKKPKKTLPAQVEQVCETCGETYLISKFTPYIKQCESCRGVKKAPAEDEVVHCDTCGETYLVSKFNPYITTCKRCAKKSRTVRKKIKNHPIGWQVISESGDFDDFTDFFNMTTNQQVFDMWDKIKTKYAEEKSHTDES